MISFTRAGPISALSRAILAIDKQLPSVRAMGNPKRRFAAAMRMSQHAAMPAPPPVQAPDNAAIIGIGQRSMVSSTRSSLASYPIASCGPSNARN